MKTFKEKDIRVLVDYIHRTTEHELRNYSISSLLRRFNKFFAFNSEFDNDPGKLLIHIKNNPEYIQYIINEITVPTTEMFRNPVLWVELSDTLEATFGKSRPINVLHSPCSTGEELYSMSILLNELGYNYKTLTGVDINTNSLNKAIGGSYRDELVGNSYKDNFYKVMGKSGKMFSDFFNKDRRYFTVKDEYKKNTYYYDHDNIDKYKINQFEVIFCRNLLIYFDDKLQSKFLNKLTKHLKPGGLLVLGSYETIRDPEILEQYINTSSPNRIYQKKL